MWVRKLKGQNSKSEVGPRKGDVVVPKSGVENWLSEVIIRITKLFTGDTFMMKDIIAVMCIACS